MIHTFEPTHYPRPPGIIAVQFRGLSSPAEAGSQFLEELRKSTPRAQAKVVEATAFENADETSSSMKINRRVWLRVSTAGRPPTENYRDEGPFTHTLVPGCWLVRDLEVGGDPAAAWSVLGDEAFTYRFRPA